LLVAGCWLQLFVFAAERPSLFRGVVVADSPVGVRVVNVEEASQAALADLRAEDVIVQVGDADVRSIDDFAALSIALKGRTALVRVLVFRNGVPKELSLHLYSYPVLREWKVAFIPDHGIRFAEPRTALDYWRRQGRGFDGAGKTGEALDAYLNGLHHAPTDAPTALKASELCSRLSREQLARGRTAAGIASLRTAVLLLERLFDYPLSTQELESVRAQLRSVLDTLKTSTATTP
jgi:membrane-associated protease RseP (regulator of RpoE activity)